MSIGGDGSSSFINGRRIFFAKTAQNFYNLQRGLWRPGQKRSKKKGSLQKSLNLLQAYGEQDTYKKY